MLIPKEIALFPRQLVLRLGSGEVVLFPHAGSTSSKVASTTQTNRQATRGRARGLPDYLLTMKTRIWTILIQNGLSIYSANL